MESLINETQSARLQINGEYTHIRSVFTKTLDQNQNQTTEQKQDLNLNQNQTKPMDYNSHLNPLSKAELRQFLEKLSLL